MSFELAAFVFAITPLVALLCYSHTRFAWGLFLVLYLIPLTTFDLPDTRPWAALVAAVQFLALLRHRTTARGADAALIALLIAMVAAFLASATWSRQPESTVPAAVAWIPLILALLSFRPALPAQVMRDIGFGVVWVCLVVSAASSVIAPALFTAGDRATGILSNANGVGVLCALSAPWIMRRGLTPASMFGCALIALLLYSSQSRAGAFGAVIGIATLVFMLSKGWVRLAMLAGLLYGAWRLASLDVIDLGTGSGLFRTNDSRSYFWNLALEQFQQQPLHGMGFAALDARVGSTYITLAAEMGLLGLVLFAAVGLRSVTLARHDSTAIAIVAAGMANAIFESWLVAAGSFYCLLFFATVVCAQRREEGTDPGDPMVDDRSNAAVHARA